MNNNYVNRKMFIFIMTALILILSGLIGLVFNTREKVIILETKFEPIERFIDKVTNGELTIIKEVP